MLLVTTSVGSRSCCLCKTIVSSPCVTHDVARAFIFHPLACTWAFHLRLSLPYPRHQPLRSRCRSINTATIHKMRSMALWSKQPLLQGMSPTWSITPTTQRLLQRSSRMDPSMQTRNRRTRSMRNSTMSFAIFTTVHSGARRINELETNLLLSWRKFKLSVLFHTNKHGETRVRTKFRFVSKRSSSRDSENERTRILLERQKEQILATVRPKIQKHELQAESDRRSIQESTGILDSDHTIKGCEQSRRDQLLLQEEISEQNRDLRETCIRNMRDMEELQKSHVLKVEELSRRKLTEDFEAVTWFFHDSNVKTVYNFGDNDAKYPDAEIDDVHTPPPPPPPPPPPGIRWLHHCTFRSEKQVRACFRLSLTKRKLVSTCTVNCQQVRGNTACH